LSLPREIAAIRGGGGRLQAPGEPPSGGGELKGPLPRAPPPPPRGTRESWSCGRGVVARASCRRYLCCMLCRPCCGCMLCRPCCGCILCRPCCGCILCRPCWWLRMAGDAMWRKHGDDDQACCIEITRKHSDLNIRGQSLAGPFPASLLKLAGLTFKPLASYRGTSSKRRY
jgi:hypothetical protein